jgi:single-strand DNA-binding protein
MKGLHAAATGRAGRDAEKRFSQQGKSIVSFSIAVDHDTRQTQEGSEADTTLVRVTLFDELADQMAERIKKGVEVFVEGRLKLDKWTTPDGVARSTLTMKLKALGFPDDVFQEAKDRFLKSAGAAVAGVA